MKIKKKHKKTSLKNTRINTHHLCWRRRKWSKGVRKELRTHPYCLVKIPRNTLHKYIHDNMGDIPIPKDCSIRSAISQLEYMENYGAISLDDPIEKRLLLLAALFEVTDQPTADAFRKQYYLVCDFMRKAPP